jgi:hypothetical protein
MRKRDILDEPGYRIGWLEIITTMIEMMWNGYEWSAIFCYNLVLGGMSVIADTPRVACNNCFLDSFAGSYTLAFGARPNRKRLHTSSRVDFG